MQAHDATNACALGDTVRIRECPPISKTKHWEVISETGAGTDGAAAS